MLMVLSLMAGSRYQGSPFSKNGSPLTVFAQSILLRPLWLMRLICAVYALGKEYKDSAFGGVWVSDGADGLVRIDDGNGYYNPE